MIYKEKVDIAVVGGGSAGISATIAAVREGARVFLIEKNYQLGGMATSACVHSICGLYRPRNNEYEKCLFINDGFPQEYVKLLFQHRGAYGPIRMGRCDVILHDPHIFSLVANHLMLKEKSLRLFFNSHIMNLHVNSNHCIEVLEIISNKVNYVIQVSAIIDTTGDGELGFLSGAEYEISDQNFLQRPAYIFLIYPVDDSILQPTGKLELARKISQAVTNKILPDDMLGISFRSSIYPRAIWATLDLKAKNFDPINFFQRKKLLQFGKNISYLILDFLKKMVSEFQRSKIVIEPSEIGVRESRRLVGKYQLTKEDILNGHEFYDFMTYCYWPIELRETSKGPNFYYSSDNRLTSIPLRALQSRNIENLFFAGRVISATHEALGSLRVIGSCFSTGEAAGKAAVRYVNYR